MPNQQTRMSENSHKITISFSPQSSISQSTILESLISPPHFRCLFFLSFTNSLPHQTIFFCNKTALEFSFTSMSFFDRFKTQSYAPSGHGGSYGHSGFPPGTHPDVIRSFQMVDRDRSGFIDENELQQALSSTYQRFCLRTIRLLMFLFKNPHDPLRIGLKEFAALWSCLGQWRAIFERYDKDRSGKIDLFELRDALYGIGYAIPASVLQILISKYDNGSGGRVELNFDCFVECGMIVKGLTEKFKEKDPKFTGSATLSYDTFMTMVLPFLVTYD